jgi:aminoglycoside phosphotransferase family enzyme
LDSSPSAFIFTAYTQKNTQVVLKVLRAYKDSRYPQANSEERLACQREALRKNLLITPDIYRGLALILEPTIEELEEKACEYGLQRITLGKIAQDIGELYTQNGEYALVMSYLPEKLRLDHLLREECILNLRGYLELLAERVAQIHKSFLPLEASTLDQSGNLWGSYKQLKEKLTHNLIHFDLIEQAEYKLYKQYSILKDAMQAFIKHPKLRKAFKERRPRYVKQCHGDLKASNIWIEIGKQNGNLMSCVSILDAVDFNESYRNIDILADLAMLVVDIEANETPYQDSDWHIGRGNKLATLVIDKYLLLTEQAEDPYAWTVLEYYLIEKAIVRAIMCLIYDHNECRLGKRFLHIAIEYAKSLGQRLNMPEIVDALCAKSLVEA